MLENIKIINLDRKSSLEAARIQANLIRFGQTIDSIDCLIAGIALANGIKEIITDNKKHFERIQGIKVISY